jgi:hypothetical protein
MNQIEYAQQILAHLPQAPKVLPPIHIDDTQSKNAGRCMTALVCNRLAAGGEKPQNLRHTTFDWDGGIFALRNARVVDHHWTKVNTSLLERLHKDAKVKPVVYLLTYFAMDEGRLHAWSVPEHVAFDAFVQLPTDADGRRTVEVSPENHQLKNAPHAPSFAPYYVQAGLTEAERSKLLEVIKTDDNVKQERTASVKVPTAEKTRDASVTATLDSEEEDESNVEAKPGYNDQTVEFLLELGPIPKSGDQERDVG